MYRQIIAILILLVMVVIFLTFFVMGPIAAMVKMLWRKAMHHRLKLPWRNLISQNHVSTAAHIPNTKTGTLVLPNYKQAL